MLALLTVIVLILVIVAIAKAGVYETRLKRLEGEIRALSGTVRLLSQKLFDPGAPEESQSARVPEPPRAAPQPVVEAVAPQPSQAATSPPPPVNPSWGPAVGSPMSRVEQLGGRTRQEWEALVGERLLNRVGAIALIIGSGFFLKYAIDRNWISPTLRVVIGLAFGALLVAGASRQRERLPIFAQGLLGAGISILYLSVYASFGFYGLIPLVPAFVVMSAVTLLAFERAMKFDSLGVALLGWAGGYLTPLLLSGGAPGEPGASNPGGLFVYLILLQAGLTALSMKRPDWSVLAPLTLGGTYCTFLLWYSAYYSSSRFWPAAVFLVAAWAMFLVADLYKSAKAGDFEDPTGLALSWVNAAAFYGFLMALVDSRYPDLKALTTFLIAASYASPILVLQRALPSYAVRAIGLLAVATWLQVDGFVLAVLWSLEALALTYCGIRMNLQHVRIAALALFAAGGIALLDAPNSLVNLSLDTYRPALNDRALSFSLVAAMLASAAFLYRRFTKSQNEADLPPQSEASPARVSDAGWAGAALNYGWATTLFVLMTVEINDYFRWLYDGEPFDTGLLLRVSTIAVAWAGYSLVLVWYGLRNSHHLTELGGAICVLAVMVAVAQGAAFEPIDEFVPILNLRVLLLILVSLSVYANARMIETMARPWARAAAGWMKAIVAAMGFVLITAEIRDFYRKQIEAGGSSVLVSRQQLALSAGWLAYSGIALGFGFWLRKPAVRIAAIGLLGLTVLKVFLYDLSFLQQLYRIISFMALGVILLGASYLYQRYRDSIFGTAGDGP